MRLGSFCSFIRLALEFHPNGTGVPNGWETFPKRMKLKSHSDETIFYLLRNTPNLREE